MIKMINDDLDKIYRRPTQSSGTVKKKKDEKARHKNVIINFRVTASVKDLIDERIRLSGLNKATFFTESCLYNKILVKGNIKTFDVLKKQLDSIAEKINTSCNLSDFTPEEAESLRIILEIFSSLYGKEN